MDDGPKKATGISRGLTNYGDADFSRYLRVANAKSMGFSDEMLSKPIVGITSTFNEFNNCHRSVPELVAAVKRGVIAAGGCRWSFRRSRSVSLTSTPPLCSFATSWPWTPRR